MLMTRPLTKPHCLTIMFIDMNETGSLGKFLVISGVALVAAGLFFMYGRKFLPLGRLPGDISIKGDNFSFHFPIVTCIIISIILTIILNLVFRR